jgi:Tti2 family
MGALSLKRIFHLVSTLHPLLNVNSLFIDSQTATLEKAIVTSQRLGLHGLQCLQSLLALHPLPSDASGLEILLSVISFTSPSDPWTTISSESIAAGILREPAHEILDPGLIIDFLLQNIIRPLFSKSKPAAITATGRKAMPSSAPPRNYSVSDSLDPAKKPWKYTSPFSIAVFEWAVKNSSVIYTL